MVLLLVYDVATAIQEQTNRRRFPLRISEGEFRGLSSIFGATRKYGSVWIGQVILIGWKCSEILTVKLNYAPNKNTSFFQLQMTVPDEKYNRSTCVSVNNSQYVSVICPYESRVKVAVNTRWYSCMLIDLVSLTIWALLYLLDFSFTRSQIKCPEFYYSAVIWVYIANEAEYTVWFMLEVSP